MARNKISALDEIAKAIEDGTVYSTYKIIDIAESYDHKPGVMVECIHCGKQKRVRYSNLKNGYTKACKCLTGDSVRDKRDYISYIGKIYQGWEILDIKPFGNNYKEGYAKIQCVNCKFTKDVLAYNLISKIDDGKNILNCGNCSKIKEALKLKQKQDEFKAKYIGIQYKDDVITDVICQNLTTLDKCIIKCSKCDRTREVLIHDFINHRDRHIIRCECDASGWNTYSKYIGSVIFGDKILKYEYTKNGKGYNRRFLVKCTNCGEERYVEQVSELVKHINSYERPKDFGYKRCNCNKGTRSENITDRYKQYIGKKIEGTKLTILDVYLKEDSNGRHKVMARTKCDCSPEKTHSHWLPAILMNHTTSCGCIGKSIGEVLVRRVLEELNIEYREQVKVPNTPSIANGNLFFDFVIRVNDKIAIIEYDGAQHYDIDAFNFGVNQDQHEEKFWRLQENDKIKNKYCDNFGYKILRIKDTEYHNDYEGIKDLINKFIKSL